jgi:hypothetical protein
MQYEGISSDHKWLRSAQLCSIEAMLPVETLLNLVAEDVFYGKATKLFDKALSYFSRAKDVADRSNRVDYLRKLFLMNVISSGTMSLQLDIHNRHLFVRLYDNSGKKVPLNTISNLDPSKFLLIGILESEEQHRQNDYPDAVYVSVEPNFIEDLLSSAHSRIVDEMGPDIHFSTDDVYALFIDRYLLSELSEVFFHGMKFILDMGMVHDQKTLEAFVEQYTPLYNERYDTLRNHDIIASPHELVTKEGLIRGFQRACRNLSWKSDKTINYEDIANLLKIHPNTLRDKLSKYDLSFLKAECALEDSSTTPPTIIRCLGDVPF